MQSLDDSSLLSATSEEGDAKAFAELCERYRQRSFNLAFRILNNSALAEEAVQESMLSIWQSAGSFNSKRGSIQNWILGIVTKKCMDLARAEKRNSKREERVAMERSRSVSAITDSLADAELVTHLRVCIDRLPEADRQLLACCYGAGLSHHQISELVGMPRQRVSEKLQQILGRLRMGLAHAGLAAVVPIVSASQLYEAITTGHECPHGMAERMVSRIELAGRKAARSMSRRAVSTRTGAWAKGVIAVVFLGAAASGWWLFQNREQVAQPGAHAESSSLKTDTAAASKPFQFRWSFEKGPASDLKVLQSNWKWQSTGANSGCMVAPMESGLLVRLPVELPAQPAVISVDATLDIAGEFFCGAYWMNGPLLVPARKWNNPRWLHHQVAPVNLKMQTYFIDRYAVTLLSDHVSTVEEARTPYPSREVAMHFARIKIQAIEIRSLSPDEIPASLRDIPALIKQMGVEPVESDERGNSQKLEVKQH